MIRHSPHARDVHDIVILEVTGRRINGLAELPATVEIPALCLSMPIPMVNECISVISEGCLEIWVTICIALGVGLVKNGLARPAGAVHCLNLNDHFPDVEHHLRAWLAARQSARHAGYPADRVYISGRTPETQRSQRARIFFGAVG